MNIILGFGKTEKDFEKQEMDFVNDYLEEHRPQIGYFNDEYIGKLKKEIEKREKYYKELDEKYQNDKNYPERYSYFNFTILNDIRNIVIIFDFWHTNRNHPFSPDGWALLRQKRILFHFDLF
ncbi:MAG: hypothetical protein XE08_0832 [Parcubacteria bacterium 32_520]|nr:MAG: hypothetical protein XE08_0832 [Parcubacteria bacterium 32_520]HBY57573.1 hypothetical protein [Candidatus Atribacteria bacterium]